MRTLSAIATVLLVSAVGSAAYAQQPVTINDGRSSDTGRTDRVERRAPKRAFEIGVSGGYTQPFGELRNNVRMGDVAVEGAAVGLSLGYRFDPNWSLEGTGQFQQMQSGASYEGTSTAIRGATMGVQGTYHFRPYRTIDPYLSLGTGYRMMWIVPTSAPNTMMHGFQVAKATLGLDVRMTPSFALGPMVGADVNVFMWNNVDGTPNTTQNQSPQPSTFVFAGLGGRFDLGGYRVPTERAVARLTPAPTPIASPPPAPKPERPMTSTGVNIEKRIFEICKIEGPKAYFDFDQAAVKETDESTLNQVATCFTHGPLKGRAMKVIGHTDPRGSDNYNQKLGHSRAESVSDYLTGQGVPEPEITTESRGEQDAEGSDEIGWAYDRRVEIRLAD